MSAPGFVLCLPGGSTQDKGGKQLRDGPAFLGLGTDPRAGTTASHHPKRCYSL